MIFPADKTRGSAINLNSARATGSALLLSCAGSSAGIAMIKASIVIGVLALGEVAAAASFGKLDAQMQQTLIDLLGLFGGLAGSMPANPGQSATEILAQVDSAARAGMLVSLDRRSAALLVLAAIIGLTLTLRHAIRFWSDRVARKRSRALAEQRLAELV